MPVQKKSLTKSATKPVAATKTKSVKASGPVASNKAVTAMRIGTAKTISAI